MYQNLNKFCLHLFLAYFREKFSKMMIHAGLCRLPSQLTKQSKNQKKEQNLGKAEHHLLMPLLSQKLIALSEIYLEVGMTCVSRSNKSVIQDKGYNCSYANIYTFLRVGTKLSNYQHVTVILRNAVIQNIAWTRRPFHHVQC